MRNTRVNIYYKLYQNDAQRRAKYYFCTIFLVFLKKKKQLAFDDITIMNCDESEPLGFKDFLLLKDYVIKILL